MIFEVKSLKLSITSWPVPETPARVRLRMLVEPVGKQSYLIVKRDRGGARGLASTAGLAGAMLAAIPIRSNFALDDDLPRPCRVAARACSGVAREKIAEPGRILPGEGNRPPRPPPSGWVYDFWKY